MLETGTILLPNKENLETQKTLPFGGIIYIYIKRALLGLRLFFNFPAHKPFFPRFFFT